jgi:hypothetical protein
MPEVVWGFERRSFYMGSMRVNLILTCQEVLEMSLALNEPNEVILHSYTSSKHASQNGKKSLMLYAKQPLKNHKGSTPDEKSH